MTLLTCKKCETELRSVVETWRVDDEVYCERCRREMNLPVFDFDFRPETYWSVGKGRLHRGTTRTDVYWNPGTEFLPEYGNREVEIARVELMSSTGDVTSVRAKAGEKFITYRVVDEYEGKYSFKPKRSLRPLSLGELINLIDGAEFLDAKDSRGILTVGAIKSALEYGEPPEDYLDFVNVSSEFYPRLEEYYDYWIRSWLNGLGSVEGDETR